MKIACATDFSPRSHVAARIAVELARRASGSVELIHVMPPPATDMQALAEDAARVDHQLRAEARARLASECRALATAAVPVTFHIDEGDVEPSLVLRARAIAADLIVVGAHAHAALERFLLGSIAERTVRIADRPVLIVPPEAVTLGPAPEHQSSAPPSLRVVVALDGRSASEGALGFARALRQRMPCDLTFLRLYWALEEYQRLGLTGARDLFAPDPEVIADLERTLRSEVGVLPGAGDTSFAVTPAWGEPAGLILDFARAARTDLVIMGAESRRGLARIGHPAVATRVAHHASAIPVAFVPPPPPPPPVVRSPSEVPGIFTALAPTDLTPAGNHAIPFAYAMVAAHGGVVELCHVHERALPSPSYAYDRAEDSLTPADRTRLEGELRALIPGDAAALGITTHVTVIDGGHPAEAIVQAAERLAVDTIVLGSHGKGGLIHTLLGSVSQAVVQKARRPVLVVPSRGPQPA